MSYYSLEPLKKECEKMKKNPYLRMICGNRTSGKTTALIMESLDIFLNTGKQTLFFYRTKAEISASHFLYEDVLAIYPSYGIERVVTKKVVQDLVTGVYALINGEEKLIAFSVYIKKPDRIKKFSPMFRDVELGIFDEFLVEDEKEYLDNEVTKIQSLCISIGRGGGKQSRPFLLYLLSNKTNICNPYFVNLGIIGRIQDNTRYIRGENFIVEFSRNESAEKAISDNTLVRALAGNDNTYINYAMGEGELLSVNDDIVKKFRGKNRYFATVFIDDFALSVREFYEDDAYYISKKIDESSNNIYYFSRKKTNILSVRDSGFSNYMFKMYKKGYLYFDSPETRGYFLSIIGKAVFNRR